MHALIDGDILAYEMGGLTKKQVPQGEEDICPEVQEGDTLPFELCWGAVERKISKMLQAVSASEYTIYLSSPIHKSWRFNIATIKPYKENRADVEKPVYWELIRTNLVLHHPCKIVENMEADDALSIEQYNNIAYGMPREDSVTVICSRDKDLNMVPGWHYSWPTGRSEEKSLWWQSEIEGLRCFYKQLLTGDTTDNILGLYGVGERSALVRQLMDLNTEQELFNHVYKCYKDRFGDYVQLFLRETGLLLWMQTHQKDRWDKYWELLNGQK